MDRYSGVEADGIRAQQNAASSGRAAPERGRPGRGGDKGVGGDYALQGGHQGPDEADWIIPVPRTYRCRQNRACQGTCKSPV